MLFLGPELRLLGHPPEQSEPQIGADMNRARAAFLSLPQAETFSEPVKVILLHLPDSPAEFSAIISISKVELGRPGCFLQESHRSKEALSLKRLPIRIILGVTEG